MAGGLPPSTPVAFVTEATTPRQRVLLTTLDRALAEAQGARIQAPAIVAIGAIVDLQPLLAPYAITLDHDR
jgi:uroporphyrin-III C-methyltransferase